MTRFMGFDPVAAGAQVASVSPDGLTTEDALELCRIVDFSREGGLPTSHDYEWYSFDGPECLFESGDGTTRLTYSNGNIASVLTAGLLADHLGCHGGQLTKHYYHWDWDNLFLDEEEESYSAYARAVADYDGTEFHFPFKMDWSRTLLSNVNMRDAPGLDGRRIVQLKEGTEIEVTDCKITGDSQGVWFKVIAQGRTGWVSARYVSRRTPTRHYDSAMIRPAR